MTIMRFFNIAAYFVFGGVAITMVLFFYVKDLLKVEKDHLKSSASFAGMFGGSSTKLSKIEKDALKQEIWVRA